MGQGRRDFEDGIELELGSTDKPSYAQILQLDKILSAQRPFQATPGHDEMLFVIIHQVQELWLKLIGHELAGATDDIATDHLGLAFKKLTRVKTIQHQLIAAWDVLRTMTPADYLGFRDALGPSSGFQSYGYRLVEFALGNKDANHILVHRHDPAITERLQAALSQPSLYDEALGLLARRGFGIDPAVLARDLTLPYQPHPSVVAAWRLVYKDVRQHWDLYELAEKLVDIEDNFQHWRFSHLQTVKRIIGSKPGTGGSSGVAFLEKALQISFFPELYEVRGLLVGTDYRQGGGPDDATEGGAPAP